MLYKLFYSYWFWIKKNLLFIFYKKKEICLESCYFYEVLGRLVLYWYKKVYIIEKDEVFRFFMGVMENFGVMYGVCFMDYLEK